MWDWRCWWCCWRRWLRQRLRPRRQRRLQRVLLAPLEISMVEAATDVKMQAPPCYSTRPTLESVLLVRPGPMRIHPPTRTNAKAVPAATSLRPHPPPVTPAGSANIPPARPLARPAGQTPLPTPRAKAPASTTPSLVVLALMSAAAAHPVPTVFARHVKAVRRGMALGKRLTLLLYSQPSFPTQPTRPAARLGRTAQMGST